jgi:glycine betaine catabolism A
MSVDDAVREGRAWHTLSGRYYRDPAVFEAEVDRLFARNWFCLGRSEPVATPGGYLAAEVVDQPVVAVRGRDGVLRAFHNVCRHRGTLLCEPGTGSLRGAIQCPYHAWTYRLDGRLAGTPHVGPDELGRGSLGLMPVRVDEWQGCLFVNLSSDAPPLEEWLGAQDDEPRRFERWNLGELRVARTTRHDVAANWKILAENYEECLHCPGVHPELVALIPIYRTGAVDEGRQDYGVSLAEGADALTATGTSRLPPLPRLSAEEASCYYGAQIFPNATFDVSGRFASLKTIIPRAVDRSTVIVEYLFAPETIALADFDPTDVVGFNELSLGQDFAICERVQRGVTSRAFRHGVYPEKDSGPRMVDEKYMSVLGSTLTADVDRTGRRLGGGPAS